MGIFGFGGESNIGILIYESYIDMAVLNWRYIKTTAGRFVINNGA